MTDNPLLKIEEVNPAEFFSPDSGAVDATLGKVHAHLKTIIHDPSTSEGYAAVISLAREVSSCKAAVEKAGRAELKSMKAIIRPFEQQVKKWVDGMNDIRDDARRPVTDLEEAEAAKLAKVRQLEQEAEEQHRLDLERREKELQEAEEKLRQQQLERECELQAEIDTRAAVERARKADEDAAKVKAQKVKIAAENKLKREQEAKEQAEQDKIAAEQRAKDALEAAERAKANAERQALEAAEQAAAAEREKAHQAELDRQAEERLKARADELRQQDEQHRAQVKSEAAEDFNKVLGSDTVGPIIVAMLEARQIRNVTLNF